MPERFLSEGDVLQGRYRIESLLSASGSGQAYKVSDLRFAGRWWVVKAFPADFPPRFREEAKALTSLNHPSLVKVVDYFEEGGLCGLVMEYVSGRSLEQILENSPGPLPERQVLSWGIQAADALIHLHETFPNLSAYRNLSLRKILVVANGQVKLVPHLFEALQSRHVPGIMGYSPPESFDEGALVDERSDVYTLGAILHRCLAGEGRAVPFVFVPLGEANPRIVSSAAAVVERATEASPERRFDSLQEFRGGLYRCLQEIFRIEPPLVPRRRARIRRNYWWLVMAASGASIVLWIYFFF